MTQYIGDNATKYADPKPSNILPAGTFGGKKRVMVDKYTFSGEASGSTVKVGGLLPAGAIITGVKLAFADLGTGTTISVGDSNSAARYKSAVDVATAAGSDQGIAVGGLGYTIGTNAGDNQVLLTTGGSTATGAVAIEIEYAVE